MTIGLMNDHNVPIWLRLLREDQNGAYALAIHCGHLREGFSMHGSSGYRKKVGYCSLI